MVVLEARAVNTRIKQQRVADEKQRVVAVNTRIKGNECLKEKSATVSG